jgi:hypothetical protein
VVLVEIARFQFCIVGDMKAGDDAEAFGYLAEIVLRARDADPNTISCEC